MSSQGWKYRGRPKWSINTNMENIIFVTISIISVVVFILSSLDWRYKWFSSNPKIKNIIDKKVVGYILFALQLFGILILSALIMYILVYGLDNLRL